LRKGAQPTEQVQKLLAITGVWEQYESERGSKAVTKLSRRAHVTGKAPRGVKQPKEAPAAEEPAAGAPVAEEPTADEVPAAEATTPEAPAEDAAEAPADEPGEESS
jgi:small subunit ribosomal protein S16